MPNQYRSGERWWCLAGLACFGGVYWWWSVCDTLTDLGGDSAMYMLMARHMSPFVTPSSVTASAVTGATYPPLFPLLIGLFGASFAAAHAIVTTALLLSLAVLYAWVRVQGVGIAPAVTVVLVFACLPGTYLLTLNIWSENLYLCLSLLAVLAVYRAESTATGASDLRYWWTAVFSTCAAAMTRAAGLALLLALTIVVTRKRPRQWLQMACVAWLPFLAWVAWSRLNAGGATHYVASLHDLYAHDFVDHLAIQLRSEAAALLTAWLALWLGAPASLSLAALLLAFGVVCSFGWFVALRNLRFDAIYLLLYLAMIFLWPWPSEAVRLFYVVIPLLLGYGFCVASQFLRDGGVRRLSAIGLIVAVSIPLVPALLVTLQRRLLAVPDDLALVRNVPSYYSDFEQDRELALATARLIKALPSIADLIPQSDCIFSIKPATVSVLTGRSARSPPPPTADDAEFSKDLRQCNYAWLMQGQSASVPFAYYPRDRLRDGYRIIAAVPDAAHEGQYLAQLVQLR